MAATKTKLPHMPLWVYDIDTDRDCRAMGDAEFGRFMRLLIRQWIEGSIPAEASDAVRDAMLDRGCEDDVSFLLSRKFGAVSDGVRRNQKCDEERRHAVAKVNKNRKSGKLGGRPKESERLSERLSETKPNGLIRASDSDSDSVCIQEGECRGETDLEFPATLQTPKFMEAWGRWKVYRRSLKKGKGLSLHAMQQQLRILEKFGHDGAITSINNSIAFEWQGLFVPKNDSPAGSPRQESTEDRIKRIQGEMTDRLAKEAV